MDNRPCVQAWSKMITGEFSSSSRVATFLSVLSQFKVDIQHISGSDNLPSEFQSRYPPECDSPSCQICKFISESSIISAQNVSTEDVLSGIHSVLFLNRPAIQKLQMECPDLRRVHAHLSQGTRPSPKKKQLTAVKRYLQKATISRDGLLVEVSHQTISTRMRFTNHSWSRSFRNCHGNTPTFKPSHYSSNEMRFPQVFLCSKGGQCNLSCH